MVLFERSRRTRTRWSSFAPLQVFLLISSLVVPLATIAAATRDTTWTGVTNSDWNTAANWSSNAVPTSSDNVFVPAGLVNYPVVSAPAAAKAVSLSAGSGNGPSLAITASSLATSGAVTVDGGSLNVSGTGVLAAGPNALIIDSGSITLSSSRTSTAGRVSVAGVLTVSAGTFNPSAVTVSETGSVTQTGGSFTPDGITVDNGGEVAVLGGTLTTSAAITNNGTFDISGAGTVAGNENLTNTGSAAFSSTGTSTIATLTTSGTFNLSAGVLKTAGAMVSAGTLSVSGGSLAPSTFSVSSGAETTVSGGLLAPRTSVSNEGMLTITGTGVLAGKRPLTNNAGGVIAFSSSGVSTIGALTNRSSAAPAGLSVSAGTVSLSASPVNTGTIVISGGTLSETAQEWRAAGALTVSAGTVDLGAMNFKGSISVLMLGGTIRSNDFSNTGTNMATGGTLVVGHNFAPTNFQATGGTVKVTGVSGSSGFTGISPCQLYNVQIDPGANAKDNVGALRCGIAGNWTNDGAVGANKCGDASAGFCGSGTSVTFNGSTSQVIGGLSSTTFGDVTIDDPQGVLLRNDQAISGTLTFLRGNVTTGSNTVMLRTVAPGVTGAGQTTGWVAGNLQEPVTANGLVSRTFDVGTASFYTPLTVDFANVVGAGAGDAVRVGVTTGDHPMIATSTITAARSVNSFWSISQILTDWTPGPYRATFVYQDGDLDAGSDQSAVVAARFDGAWSSTITASNSGGPPLSTSIASTAFGDFAIGDPKGGATTTAVVSSADPVVFGQSVTLTATVTNGGAPVDEGSVTFRDTAGDCSSGALLAGPSPVDGDGQASFTTSALSVGSHVIRACYGGTSDFAASIGTIAEVVDQASTSTSLTSIVNPTLFGQSTTFTTTVSAVAPGAGIPTGTVTFQDGTVTIATRTLDPSGVATLSTSDLSLGSHAISAVYAGDTAFIGSVSEVVSQVVGEAATSTVIVSSAASTTYGESVVFTARVAAAAPGAGRPTGSVLFYDGTTLLGSDSLDSAAEASITTSALGAESHSISAVYTGDTDFTASTSPTIVQTVAQATLHVNAVAASKTYGDPDPTFAYSLSGLQNGEDATSAGVAGTAACGRSGAENVGTYTISCDPGVLSASNYAFATGTTAGLTISQRPITVTADDQTKVYGDADPLLTYEITSGSLAFSDAFTGGLAVEQPEPPVEPAVLALDTVDGCADGSTLRISGSNIVIHGDVVSNGGIDWAGAGGAIDGAFTYRTPCIYAGHGHQPATPVTSVSSDPFTYTVADFTCTNGSPLPSKLELPANGSLIPDGTYCATTSITIKVAGARCNACTLIAPVIQISAANVSLRPREHNVLMWGTGAGDAINWSGIGADWSGIVYAPNGAAHIGAADNATITGAIWAKTVELPGSDWSLTAPWGVGGIKNVGTYPITQWTLSAGPNYLLTFVPGNLTVTRATSSTTVGSSLPQGSVFGQPVTFTAAISGFGAGSATGHVEFVIDGDAPVSVEVSGYLATYTTSDLSVGSHSVTATYSGDANISGSTGSLAGGQSVNE